MIESYTEECTGGSTAKVKECYLLEFKYKKDKKKYDSLPDPHATYFKMECLEKGRLILHSIPLT